MFPGNINVADVERWVGLLFGFSRKIFFDLPDDPVQFGFSVGFFCTVHIMENFQSFGDITFFKQNRDNFFVQI